MFSIRRLLLLSKAKFRSQTVALLNKSSTIHFWTNAQHLTCKTMRARHSNHPSWKTKTITMSVICGRTTKPTTKNSRASRFRTGPKTRTSSAGQWHSIWTASVTRACSSRRPTMKSSWRRYSVWSARNSPNVRAARFGRRHPYGRPALVEKNRSESFILSWHVCLPLLLIFQY